MGRGFGELKKANRLLAGTKKSRKVLKRIGVWKLAGGLRDCGSIEIL